MHWLHRDWTRENSILVCLNIFTYMYVCVNESVMKRTVHSENKNKFQDLGRSGSLSYLKVFYCPTGKYEFKDKLPIWRLKVTSLSILSVDPYGSYTWIRVFIFNFRRFIVAIFFKKIFLIGVLSLGKRLMYCKYTVKLRHPVVFHKIIWHN